MASSTNKIAPNWKPTKVSAKRDFPDAFYDQSAVLVKKQKVFENDDYISLETDSTCSESCSSGSHETHGSEYDIIPRIYDAAVVDDNFVDDVLDHAEEEDDKRDELGGPYVELRFHGVCLKDVNCYKKLNKLKIELGIFDLQEKNIHVKALVKGSRTRESVVNMMTNERIRNYEEVSSCSSRRRRLVSAVRCFPLGCGPNAAFLSDEDLKKVIEGSRKHMLT